MVRSYEEDKEQILSYLGDLYLAIDRGEIIVQEFKVQSSLESGAYSRLMAEPVRLSMLNPMRYQFEFVVIKGDT